MAVIYTALGDYEEALAWLERTCEARDSGELVLIKVDPRMEELRSHPRFASLLRRMKLHILTRPLLLYRGLMRRSN
ncbi:MAG: TPR end-of-group domain-containing protein [Pyrinomonadaceae bacterium]